MNKPPNPFFETVKNKIYPWMIPIPWDPTVPSLSPISLPGTPKPSPIRVKWLGNLGIQLVADLGDSWRIINIGDTNPGMTFMDVFDLAIFNLANQVEYKIAKMKFGGHTVIAPKDHVAECILLSRLWEWAPKEYDDNLVIAIPSREHVFFMRESDKDIMGDFGYVVTETFNQAEYPLTKMLLRLDKETIKFDILEVLP